MIMPGKKQDTSGSRTAFDPATGLVTMTVSRQAYRPKTREEAMAAAKAYAESLTPEEDAALARAALEDPDTVLITELSKRRPGRPVADVTKTAVSIRLSPDVLDHFRSGGPGWQGRIDDVLREAAGLKKRA
jgi:uncharacterized protein (DUF4415 family)